MQWTDHLLKITMLREKCVARPDTHNQAAATAGTVQSVHFRSNYCHFSHLFLSCQPPPPPPPFHHHHSHLHNYLGEIKGKLWLRLVLKTKTLDWAWLSWQSPPGVITDKLCIQSECLMTNNFRQSISFPPRNSAHPQLTK